MIKYKFKLVKMPNGRLVVKKKCWFWYETLFYSPDFSNYIECVDYIYERYDEDYCEIKYDREW